jgi:hypothetical protein
VGVAVTPPLLTVHVPIITVSEANRRDHFRVKAKRVASQRDTVAWSMRAKAGSRPGIVAALSHGLVVTLVRCSPRSLDSHDNLRSALKATVDELAAWLGLASDSDLRVTWGYRQERRVPPHVRVEFRVRDTETTAALERVKLLGVG